MRARKKLQGVKLRVLKSLCQGQTKKARNIKYLKDNLEY